MNVIGRLLRQPQQVWLRRAIFQIHLWSGLALGLYVVVLCLTGSVLVYRIEIDRLLATPRATLNEQATPLTADQIRAAAERAHPGWTVVSVHEGRYRARGGGGRPRRPPDPTASVVFERNGETRDRLFDPYTGADLGDNVTRAQEAFLWVVSLHDDLLLDRPEGTRLNGALSLAFTVVVLTGAIVWWPGIARWKRSLGVKVTGGWRRVNWDLHSALGFWLLPFMVMWGVSGWYMGMPDPLTTFVEGLSDPNGTPGTRPGDLFLEWLPRLHFGRWRDPTWGPWLKALWAMLGLVPAAMFATGAIMWWNRVVRPRRAKHEVRLAERA
jgi:uncharacterized iron-regulated membrane protein